MRCLRRLVRKYMQEFPELQITMDEVVRHERKTSSGLQAESVKNIQDAGMKFASANPSTFLITVWKLLVHSHRYLRLESTTGEVERTKRARKKDGLCLNWQLRLAPPTPTAPRTQGASARSDIRSSSRCL